MLSQPASFAWSVTGGGSIGATGVFNATAAGENFSVSASASGFTGFATVTVTRLPAEVQIGNTEQVADGQPRAVTVTTVPENLAVSVTYDGSATPPSAPGNYTVQAVVTDPDYLGGAEAVLVITAPATSDYGAWRDDKFGPDSATDPDAEPGADPDGDGTPNLAEYHLGTDPGDPDSRLRTRLVSSAGGEARLEVSPVAAVGTFHVQQTSDPTAPWTDPHPLGTVEGGASAIFTLPVGGERGYFRILYTPPALP
jgi:hypothetical protein